MPAPHGTFVPLISPPGYRTSQGGGRSWCARPGQALPRALPRLHDWGKVPLSLSQSAAIAFSVGKTYGPSHLGRVEQEGPGYGTARCLFLNVTYRQHPGPHAYQHPHLFSVSVPCSFCLCPSPHHSTEHVPSSNSFEPLLALRPCPGHLPQKALLIELLTVPSIPHLALERLRRTLTPSWRPPGPSRAPCPLGQRGGGDQNIATWF